MVSLQSQIFLGVLTWAIEAALIVFSRLPLGASCSPAPVILPSMYCRVSETRLKSCLTIFRQQPSAVSQWPEVSPGGCPRDAAHPTQTTWQCTCRYIRMYLAVPNPLQRHSIYIKGGGGGRKGSGKLEGHKGEWGGQPEKWGENQVTPFSATFPVPLWEIEPSLFVVGFSFFKGLHQRPLNSKLARVRGCVSACVRHCHRSGQDAEWPLEQKPLLTRYIVIVF